MASGNQQFPVIAAPGGRNSGHHGFRGLPNPGPAGGGQDKDRDAAVLEVLLLTKVGIGCHQQLVTLLLRQPDQLAIGDGRPAQLVSRGNDVAIQIPAQGNGCPLIKQDPHSDHRRGRAPSDMLQNQPGLHDTDAREQLDELLNGNAIFQIFEQGCHRNPRTAKHPGTTDAQRILLHGRAIRPGQIRSSGHRSSRQPMRSG